MTAPRWKFHPVSSWAQLTTLLRRLESFLWQRQKRDQETTVRCLRLQLGSLPLNTTSSAAFGASDTGVGDVARYQHSAQEPPWIITDAILEVTTAASGVTLSIGTADDDETTSTNLFSAQSVASTGIFLGSRGVRFSDAQYINATASADPSGLTGNLYILYTVAGVGEVSA